MALQGGNEVNINHPQTLQKNYTESKKRLNLSDIQCASHNPTVT